MKNFLLKLKLVLFSNSLKNPEDVDESQITHLLFLLPILNSIPTTMALLIKHKCNLRKYLG
jgi:hypothetical protein